MSSQTPPVKGPPPTTVQNIHTVAQIELDALRARTAVDRFTERVTRAATSSLFSIIHVVWFALWIGLNTLTHWRFDPYPFSFLTLVVSLEAIVLTGFVLRDQAYMASISDQRANLDLQVNLLGEQELTAILGVMCGMARHVGYDPHQDNPRLRELVQHTNVKELAEDINRAMNPVSDGEAAKGAA